MSSLCMSKQLILIVVCTIPYSLLIKMMERNDMIWYDMIWYDMIWYDMIWYDMIWYDVIFCFLCHNLQQWAPCIYVSKLVCVILQMLYNFKPIVDESLGSILLQVTFQLHLSIFSCMLNMLWLITNDMNTHNTHNTQ